MSHRDRIRSPIKELLLILFQNDQFVNDVAAAGGNLEVATPTAARLANNPHLRPSPSARWIQARPPGPCGAEPPRASDGFLSRLCHVPPWPYFK